MKDVLIILNSEFTVLLFTLLFAVLQKVQLEQSQPLEQSGNLISSLKMTPIYTDLHISESVIMYQLMIN